MTAQWSQPLTGIRVLDFSMALAGPFCGAMLGALGAEVIKVESSARMDTTRGVHAGAGSDVNAGRTYHLFNFNKRSIALNLEANGAIEIAEQLVSKSDVVLEAFRPGVLQRFGLDYARLREVKPNLLMTSISGSGQTGPDAAYGGYAAIFAAQGGLAYLTGYSDGIPTEWRGSVDLRVGTAAFLATLVGIARLRRTGEGGHIDLAGREVVSVLVGDAMVAAQCTAQPPRPAGNEDRIMAPHGCFRTADPNTWVTVAVGTDAQWRSFCEVARLSGLRDDERYADAFCRWKQRDALNAAVRDWMGKQQRPSDVVRRLEARGVSASLSLRIDQIHRDRHLKTRSFWQPYMMPTGAGSKLRGPKQVQVMGAPWFFDGARDFFRVAVAPNYAEDNEYIYMNMLGLPRARYEELVEARVIF